MLTNRTATTAEMQPEGTARKKKAVTKKSRPKATAEAPADNEPVVKRMDIQQIVVDTELQSRVDYHKPTIADYVEAYESGTKLPPVDVFYFNYRYHLAGGYHRLTAAKKAGRKLIDVRVHQGDKNAAIAFSVGQNHDHGLRRTNADKRRAVKMLLAIPGWKDKTDRAIAKACNVSHVFVAKVRGADGNVSTCGAREGADGKSYPVKPKPDPAPVDEQPAVDQPDTEGLTCSQCGGTEFDGDGCCVACNSEDDPAADDPLLQDDQPVEAEQEDLVDDQDSVDDEPEHEDPPAEEDYFDQMIRVIRRAARYRSAGEVIDTLERMVEDLRNEEY